MMSMPLLQKGFAKGDDYLYHLSRIQNISDCLSTGIFPCKIHISSINGYGYGSGLFYPNLFIYFPALLRFLGLGLSLSYKIFLLFVIFSVIISSYFSAKYIFKSRYAAIITSLLFTTSQAIITNMYFRAAVGETLASIFIPIVIAALYNIIYDNFSKPWITILGFLGLIYCHTISLFLSALVFAFVLIINYNKFLNKGQNAKILIKLFLSATITLLLSISYWLPMLEQIYFEKFVVNSGYGWVKVGNYSLKLGQLFSNSRPGLGLPLLIISAIAIIFLKNRRNKLNLQFIIIGLFLALLSTNLFRWELLNNTIINKIQFPWRLHPLSVAFLSMGIGGCINSSFRKLKEREIILISVFCLAGIFSLNVLSNFSINNTNYLPSDIGSNPSSIMGAEWLPLNTDRSKLNTPNKVYTSNEQVINLSKKEGNTICFKYDQSEHGNSDYFDVPLLFYKGYTASILMQDGTVKKLDVVNSKNNNLVRVINNDNVPGGEICVRYSGTMLQYISYLINILMLIIIIIFKIIDKSCKKGKKYEY